MRIIFIGAALAAFVVTPALADYYVRPGTVHETVQDC